MKKSLSTKGRIDLGLQFIMGGIMSDYTLILINDDESLRIIPFRYNRYIGLLKVMKRGTVFPIADEEDLKERLRNPING